MKLSIKNDLVTFTEEILNGKLHFLCSEKYRNVIKKSQDFKQYNQEIISQIPEDISEKNLDEFTKGTIRWVACHHDSDSIIYFDSSRAEHIPDKVNRKI